MAFSGPGQPCPAAERRLNSSTDHGEIRKLPLQLTTLHVQPVPHAHAALQLMRRETDKKFQLANQVRLIIKKVAHNVPPVIIAADHERSHAQLQQRISEEHQAELQSITSISFAIFTLN